MSYPLFARVRALGLTLPGVAESTSYGTPALKVRNKFLARMKEDGETLVLKCADMDEKEFLLQTAPAIFFETDHYKGWTSLLVHLDQISDAQLFELIEQGWRREAGKQLIAQHDQNKEPSLTKKSVEAPPKPPRPRSPRKNASST